MIPTTYQRRLAKLLIKRDECGDKLRVSSQEAEVAGISEDPKMLAAIDHLRECYRRAEHDVKMFLCGITANPKWFEEVVMWMVDIQGVTAGDVEQFKDPATKGMATSDPETFRQKLMEVGGSQMQEVADLMSSDGHEITDRTLSRDGRWLLGSPCNEEDSRDLCQMLYERYADEIEMGLIIIRRMPWNMGIQNMTSAAEAREWLRKNPES